MTYDLQLYLTRSALRVSCEAAMRFIVTVIDKNTGEPTKVELDGSDERTVGWQALQRGLTVLSIEPSAPPVIPPHREMTEAERIVQTQIRNRALKVLWLGLVVFLVGLGASLCTYYRAATSLAEVPFGTRPYYIYWGPLLIGGILAVVGAATIPNKRKR